MEKFILEPTKDTPRIVLDKALCSIEITGSSYPSNAVKIYNYVYDWLEELEVVANLELTCEFYFTYLNSSSKSALFEILKKIELLHKAGMQVEINWKYDAFDEDMKEVGKEFNYMMKNIQFRMLPQDSVQE